MRRSKLLIGSFALLLAIAVGSVVIGQRFRADLRAAQSRAAQGAAIAPTRCGPMEYQEAGEGVPPRARRLVALGDYRADDPDRGRHVAALDGGAPGRQRARAAHTFVRSVNVTATTQQ